MQKNKKFCEELIVYFFFIRLGPHAPEMSLPTGFLAVVCTDTDCIENGAANSFPIAGRCLAATGYT
jgi:hypothetical protein